MTIPRALGTMIACMCFACNSAEIRHEMIAGLDAKHWTEHFPARGTIPQSTVVYAFLDRGELKQYYNDRGQLVEFERGDVLDYRWWRLLSDSTLGFYRRQPPLGSPEIAHIDWLSDDLMIYHFSSGKKKVLTHVE